MDRSSSGPSMDSRVLVAVTNKFLQESVDLLNNVCTCAEEKMMSVFRRMQRVEDSLAILEAKLNSVPEIAQSLGGAPSSDPVNTEHLQTAEHPQPQPVGNGDTNKVENADGENAVAAVPQKKNSEDERYVKYFKMLKMGVPLQAVKNKVKQEGLDDSVLDDPDGPVNDMVSHGGGEKVNEDESSEGDESDSWED